jgi:hypothetical protein
VIGQSFGQKGVGIRMANVVSVSDFSAKGDGTDDTASIKAALLAAAGKTLVFEPYKTYFVTEEIEIPKHTTVDLQGATIQFHRIGQGYLFKLSNNVSIANGTIQNTGGTGGAAIEGYRQTIFGFNVKSITIKNIEFQHGLANLIAIGLYGDVSNILVENVHGGLPSGFQPIGTMFISHWWWNTPKYDKSDDKHADGRKTNHPRNIVVRNITAEGQMKEAVWLSGSYNCKLQNISVEAAKGITVYPGDYGQDFVDSKFIRKINRNIEIENVMITNCLIYGVRLTSYGGHKKSGYVAKPVTGNISLRNFTIVGKGEKIQEGVFASGATNARICDGTITSFQRGITLGKEAYGIAIENVIINSCKTSGISISHQPEVSRSISITNCKIHNNNQQSGDKDVKANSGIYLNNCSDVKISNNSFGQISGDEKQYASVCFTNSANALYFQNNHYFSALRSKEPILE